MKEEVFKAGLALANDYDFTIVLGGGEPTLHPQFETFLIHAIAAGGGRDRRKPFIVTNGSIKKRALLIHQLAVANIIKGKLSYDQFHNLKMVDEEVIEAFRESDDLWGPPYGIDEPVRATSQLFKRGRATRFEEAKDECICPEWMVKPNGDIYQCACPDAPKIGDVWNGVDSPCCECWHSEEYKEALTNV